MNFFSSDKRGPDFFDNKLNDFFATFLHVQGAKSTGSHFYSSNYLVGFWLHCQYLSLSLLMIPSLSTWFLKFQNKLLFACILTGSWLQSRPLRSLCIWASMWAHSLNAIHPYFSTLDLTSIEFECSSFHHCLSLQLLGRNELAWGVDLTSTCLGD